MDLGDKVFFVGDGKDPEGWGEITKIEYHEEYGLIYDVKLKDGRRFFNLSRHHFDKTSHQKFKLVSDVV